METKEEYKLFSLDKLEQMTGKEVNDKLLTMPIFKCVACSNMLKAPIILVNNIGNVCGTCRKKYPKRLQIRNEGLEIVFHNIIFTCQWKGCNKKLNYSEIVEHEPGCKYRDFKCPLNILKNCKWAQNMCSIKNHFIDSHNDDIKINTGAVFKVNVNISNGSEWINLLYDCYSIFVLHLRYDIDDSVLKCMVYHIKSDYDLSDHGYVVNYEDEFYAANLRTILKNEEMNDSFGAYEMLIIDLPQECKEIVSFSLQINDINSTASKEKKILKIFLCPGCRLYMKRPIFQCLKGHSMCSYCRIHLTECPLCKYMLSETRNFALEKCADLLRFPCRYQRKGCNVIKKGDEIGNHEEECLLR